MPSVFWLALLGAVVFALRDSEGFDSVTQSISDWYSQAIALLQNLEGFSPVPYADARGQSIGYGHFIQPGEHFTQISQAEAIMLLQADISTASRAIENYVRVPLTSSQRAALVSFVYNVGSGAFADSTLLKRLNAGDYSGAASEFDRWIYTTKPGGEKVQSASLIARRETERATFEA